MSKFIIENRSDLNDIRVMNLVREVVHIGRVSNYGKQYCYLVRKKIDNKYYVVWTKLNKKSDRFVIDNDNTSEVV